MNTQRPSVPRYDFTDPPTSGMWCVSRDVSALEAYTAELEAGRETTQAVLLTNRVRQLANEEAIAELEKRLTKAEELTTLCKWLTARAEQMALALERIDAMRQPEPTDASWAAWKVSATMANTARNALSPWIAGQGNDAKALGQQGGDSE